jgi:hypothetical protein
VHHFDDVEKGIGFLHEQAAKYDKTKKGVQK